MFGVDTIICLAQLALAHPDPTRPKLSDKVVDGLAVVFLLTVAIIGLLTARTSGICFRVCVRFFGKAIEKKISHTRAHREKNLRKKYKLEEADVFISRCMSSAFVSFICLCLVQLCWGKFRCFSTVVCKNQETIVKKLDQTSFFSKRNFGETVVFFSFNLLAQLNFYC